MKVVVVGGGVVGLSTAHALLEAGCDVTVFDAQAIPNPASASYDRSRMMRLQYGIAEGVCPPRSSSPDVVDGPGTDARRAALSSDRRLRLVRDMLCMGRKE